MTATVEELQPFSGKELQLTVRIDGQEVTDKFLLQGALPQGIVVIRKKSLPQVVSLEDVLSYEEPAPEPVKLKIKHLKAVTLDDVAQHVLDRHGATVEWVEQNTAEDQLAWHEEMHTTYNFGHDHKTDKADKPAGESTESAQQDTGEASQG